MVLSRLPYMISLSFSAMKRNEIVTKFSYQWPSIMETISGL